MKLCCYNCVIISYPCGSGGCTSCQGPSLLGVQGTVLAVRGQYSWGSRGLYWLSGASTQIVEAQGENSNKLNKNSLLISDNFGLWFV